jgi:hypothetical protein
MPGLYHKLQNYVCTAFLQLFGDIKLALIASIVVFSLVGAWGLRRLALELGARLWTATLLAMALPFTGYATADWLIRGAFAEHAAFMLLPWLFVALLPVVRSGHIPVLRLWMTLSLLFLAHSVMALYSGGLVLLALTLSLERHGRRWRLLLGRALLAGLSFLLSIAPFAWASRVLVKPLYFEYMTSGYYAVENHLTTLANAMFFGAAPVIDFRVAPDPVLWCSLALAALFACHPRLRLGPRSRRFEPLTWFFALTLAGYLLLRLEGALPLYEHVPGLRFIQFPWRLIPFCVIAMLLLLAGVLARLRRGVGLMVALATAGWLALNSRAFRFHEDVWMTHAQLLDSVDPSTDIRWIPYLPAVPHPATRRQLELWSRGPAVRGGDCEVSTGATVWHWRLNCSKPAGVALPFMFSGLERVVDGTGDALAVSRTRHDPRVRVDVPAGPSELSYQAPSWSTLLRSRVLDSL